jgi:hypothetical protein
MGQLFDTRQLPGARDDVAPDGEHEAYDVQGPWW